MKKLFLIIVLTTILGLPLTAQCNNNPSNPYQVIPSQRIPQKARHSIQRINRAPIRYFHHYPQRVAPRNQACRSYRSPRIYVYANPSCSPSRSETNYNIYNQYEYSQEYPTPDYYENSDENPNNYYYDSEAPSDPSFDQAPNSYYIERSLRSEEEAFDSDSKANESKENAQNPLPIQDFFYFMETGRELFKRGQYEQASKEFSQAVLLDRYSYAAHWGHGLSMFATGQYASASFSFRKGLDCVLNPLAVHENLRRYYQDLSRFEKQLDQLEHHIRTYPFDLDAYFVLAFSQFYTDNYPEAQPLLEYILKIAPRKKDAQAQKLLQAIPQERIQQKHSSLPSEKIENFEKTPSTESLEFPQNTEATENTSSLSPEEIRALEDELLESSDDSAPKKQIQTSEATTPEESVVPKNTNPPTSELKEEKSPELTEEEKQRLIQENNEKALENYEKLLKEMRPKKSSQVEPLENKGTLLEEKSPPLPETKTSLPKPKARTRLQIQAEIQNRTNWFQDQKFNLLTAYTQLKRQYYAREIDDAYYQEISASYIAQYEQLQKDFALQKEHLQSELNSSP
ncbi:MAG: hypothetical protein AABZ60_16740 [Planctomycetota bacterium]